ncbi:MAG: hypothetical protein MJK10_21250 [Pseudomonadales bacterium]|nr:hypothetical protein [Pseudomonadales bacterium]NRA18634.1 hypothetical protein [Oceanospirillaceae bacterium]
MAQLTWKLVELTDVQATRTSIITIATNQLNSPQETFNSINIIRVNHLFGQPPSVNPVTVTKSIAPKKLQKSKLNIRLTGLLNGRPSVAVIVHKGAQGAYLINEYIVKTKKLHVQLTSIHNNYVIISNNGTQERLSLPKLNTKSLAQTGIIVNPAPNKTTPTTVIQLDLNSPQIRAILGAEPKKIITGNPLALAKFMQISPSIKRGQLHGYIISSGPDERLLQMSGIRAGDIITHLDGQAVAGLTLPGIFQSLNSSNQFKVTVDRSGTIITMDIKL